jgi:hypothetical protein
VATKAQVCWISLAHSEPPPVAKAQVAWVSLAHGSTEAPPPAADGANLSPANLSPANTAPAALSPSALSPR